MILEFLSKNKEWIFSGVGVVIIASIVSFVYKKLTKSERNGTAHITIVHVSQDQPQPRDESAPAVNSSHLMPAHITRVSSIAFKEIYAALEAAVPLQKGQVAKSYEGIYVRWDAHLYSAEMRSDDEVRLSLDIDDRTHQTIRCVVNFSEYKEIGVLQKGAPITVIGRIKEVDSLSIYLDDVHLYFNA